MDIRADVYSLGATFYFLLVGRPPFADGTLNQKLIWHQMKAPTPVRKLRPEVPEAMAAVLERMMAKDAANRYQTPAEVVAALAPWTRTALPPPPAAEMPPVRPPARAGKPWRKTAGSAGSTVVQRATRPTALHAPSTVPNAPPVAPPKAVVPNLELPPATPPPAAVPMAAAAPQPPRRSGADPDRSKKTTGRTCSTTTPTSPSRSLPPPRAGAAAGVSPSGFGRNKWHFVGAGAALVLLGVGVWAVIAFGRGASKPSVPPPADSAPEAVEAPRGPVNLRAAAKGPDAIELTWQDPHGPSDGFRIERATDRWFSAKNTAVAAVIDGNVTRYTDGNLKPGPAYFYRVRALRGMANPACPTPPGCRRTIPRGSRRPDWCSTAAPWWSIRCCA